MALVKTSSGGLMTTSGGGISNVAVSQVSAFATDFTLENTNSGGASVGIKKFGVLFKKGDVPSGFKPVFKISDVEMDAYQFNKYQTWDDDSLRWVRCHTRESNYSASESHTIDATAEAGSITSTGVLTLSDITSNSDFKIEVTNLKQLEDTKNIVSITKANPAVIEVTAHGLSAGELYILNVGGMTEVNNRKFAFTVQDVDNLVLTGEDSSAYGTASGGKIRELTTVGSGSYAAEFNTHSAVATRREIVDDGDVALSYKVWGQVDDDTGDAEHAHLKPVWHITAWDDGIGGILRFEVEVEMRLDWWSVASPRSLWYDLELFDGVTSIETYTSIHHPYRCRWRTWRKTADLYEGTRHWVGGSEPTIHYTHNAAYWVTTLAVFGYNQALDLSAEEDTHNYAIRPCEASGGTYDPVSPNAGHRDVGMNATGGYMARGMNSSDQVIAFIEGSPEALRTARKCAHSVLHGPIHFVSNKTRTRPTEGADTANTVIALNLPGFPGGVENSSGDYDWTADGMPASATAYSSAGGDSDGYVAAGGGEGIWTGVDQAHSTNPGEMTYLLEAEEWAYDAVISQGVRMATERQFKGEQTIWYDETQRRADLSIPNEFWEGVIFVDYDNDRANAWSLNSIRVAAMIAAVGTVEYNYLNDLLDHQIDYVERSADFFDQAQIDLGLFLHWNAGQTAPWGLNWIVMATMGAYAIRRDNARALTIATIAKNFPETVLDSGFLADWGAYRREFYNVLETVSTKYGQTVASVTVGYVDATEQDRIYASGQLEPTANTITINVNKEQRALYEFSVDDRLRVIGVVHESGMSNITPPAEFDLAKEYWVKTIASGGSVITLSETQGGAEFDITTAAGTVYFVCRQATRAVAIATEANKSISDDASDRFGVAALVSCVNVGLVSEAKGDTAVAYVNTNFTVSGPAWDIVIADPGA